MKIKIEPVKFKECIPFRAHETDSGMDLKSEEQLILPSMSRRLVSAGIKIEIPPGYEGQIRPRSGFAFKQGVTVLNSPGTIDCSFRGVVCVILYNTTTDDIEINQFDRIAQLTITKIELPEIEIGKVGETERGEGGFGSTGI